MTTTIPPKHWLSQWKRRREEKWRAEGFDWAAGMLLRGSTKVELEAYIQDSSGCDSFDQGVIEAIREWILRGLPSKGDFR